MRKLLTGQRFGGHKVLAVIGIVGILLVALAFSLRANNVDDESNQLCNVLYTMIARSGANVGAKGYPGYAYYSAHPDELTAAREQNEAFLAELPCEGPPVPLP